jgi:hypothetical protein
MTCPGCGERMQHLALAGRYGRTLTIDLCSACAHVWFDGHEDLHLAPASVLRLFEAMGRAAAAPRGAVAARKACPRCATGLLRTHDRIRQTPYEYFRCTQGHGRFMGFAAFLRARQFVRDLSEDEVRALRVEARVIKCANCGAATDISTRSTCAYCQAPIAILDADQLAKTIAELTAAEAKSDDVDPTWPLRAEQARRQTEAVFAELRRGRGASADLDLVTAGLTLFAGVVTRLLR